VLTDLFWEKNTIGWWLISQTNASHPSRQYKYRSIILRKKTGEIASTPVVDYGVQLRCADLQREVADHSTIQVSYCTLVQPAGYLSDVLPPSQNICTCWLLRFTFDHSSYTKKLWKCYLFCYDMFYHCIYFKYIIIIFVFSQIFWIRRMVKCDL
jgi:hypothetical protein